MLLMPVVACAWLSYIVVSCNLITKLDIRVLLLENMDCSRAGLLNFDYFHYIRLYSLLKAFQLQE